jgi:hypothetical protein
MSENTTVGAISFRFEIALDGHDGEPVTFTLRIDESTLNQAHDEGPQPDWARLEYYQCPGCPLDVEKHPQCPAALSLAELIEQFGPYMSYDKAEMTVETRERRVTAQISLQSALRSILGLYLATSGCPVLAKFKPMARFHLPFASRDETVFRAASAYMLAQYRLKQLNRPYEFGLDGLRGLYKDVSRINQCLANRIRGAAKGDAHLNAISLLDIFAQELTYSINDEVAELDYLFRAYIGD